MHVFVIFIEFSSINFGGKPRKSFFINIDPQWLIACNNNIYSQIKFIAINQKRICYIS